jgi:hypothetical protein
MSNHQWLFFQNRKTAAEIWTALLDPELEQSDLVAALGAVEADKDDIIEDAVCTAKEIAGLIKLHKEEEERLAQRRRTLLSKLDTIEAWLGSAIGPEGWERGFHRLSWRKSKSVEVEDAEKLPLEFTRVKLEADKTALKKALEGGATFEGVKLVEKSSLQVK